MSGISVGTKTYVDTAKLGDGDIRLAKDGGGELVNKGTLGNKIASFFHSIGRALGLVESRSADRAQRQQAALEGFKNALVQDFGQVAGSHGAIGLGDRLTGRTVQLAMESARGQYQYIKRGNDMQTGVNELKGSAQTLGVDPGKLTGQQSKDYSANFEKGKETVLNGEVRPLSTAELKSISEDALRAALGKPSAREEKAQLAFAGNKTAMMDALNKKLEDTGWKPTQGILKFNVDRIVERTVKELQGRPGQEPTQQDKTETIGRLSNELRQNLTNLSQNNDGKEFAKLDRGTIEFAVNQFKAGMEKVGNT
jgi:hypothetical protein